MNGLENGGRTEKVLKSVAIGPLELFQNPLAKHTSARAEALNSRSFAEPAHFAEKETFGSHDHAAPHRI